MTEPGPQGRVRSGQLRLLIQGEFLKQVEGLNKVQGKPFNVKEIISKIKSLV